MVNKNFTDESGETSGDTDVDSNIIIDNDCDDWIAIYTLFLQ